MSEPLSPGARRGWRLVQLAVFALGLGIVVALVAAPSLGLHAFWNVLIPLAPALLVFAPGTWRNVCPLATSALLPRHAGRSARRPLPRRTNDLLTLLGVGLLFLIVPLRHVVLDTSGPATAVTLCAIGALALAMGALFEWKSGWCSGMCPVHPVEKLYGCRPIVSAPNAHCVLCERCVDLCPDSTRPNGNGRAKALGYPRWLAETLMIGAFPGFIWGWFHVRDYEAALGFARLDLAYGYPLGAGALTFLVYLLARGFVARSAHATLARGFAAAAVGCYYWYRLPMLAGFGHLGADGMLVDLSASLPSWSATASRALTSPLFAWWLLRASARGSAWLSRPPRAADEAAAPAQ